MDNNLSNIYTIAGGVLLGMGIADKITKMILPEMQKLTSGETIDLSKLLPSGEEDQLQEKEKQKYEERPKREESEYQERPEERREKRYEEHREERPAQRREESRDEHRKDC